MITGEDGIAVRPAADVDLSALERLEEEGFPEPWSSGLLTAELHHPASLVLVATTGGDVVGYASFRRAADEAELLRIAVAPTARSRGVGRRLVETGLGELARRGVIRCFLEVRPHNAPARALYRRLGFQETGRRRGYYADGSDALLLSRALAPAPSSPSGATSRHLDPSPTG